MPARGSNKRRYRKRRNRRRYYRGRKRFPVASSRGRGSASLSTFRASTVIPDRMFLKLKYNDIQSLNTFSQAYQDYIYRGNSVYDPNYTGTGNQPQGFDEWSAFYGQYRVYGSKMTCTFIDSSGTNYAQSVAIIPNLSTTAFTDPIRVIETPYSSSSTITLNSGLGKRTLSSYMSTAKMWGIDKQTVSSGDLYRATTGNNPTNNWYWHVFAYDMGASEASVYIQVKITYYLEMFDRVQLNTS